MIKYYNWKFELSRQIEVDSKMLWLISSVNGQLKLSESYVGTSRLGMTKFYQEVLQVG